MRWPSVFKHGGYEYQIGRLDAFQQFHVGRRLAPMMASFAHSWKDGEFDPTPLAEALAKMPQDDADYVTKTCLTVVSRKSIINSQEVWQPVMTKNGMGLMFEDISGGDLIRLSTEVVQQNLGDFFPTAQLPSS